MIVFSFGVTGDHEDKAPRRSSFSVFRKDCTKDKMWGQPVKPELTDIYTTAISSGSLI